MKAGERGHEKKNGIRRKALKKKRETEKKVRRGTKEVASEGRTQTLYKW